MFDRFRQKYPQGSITSSLIQIHNDRYIVSVSIKVDGVVLATTLAADEQIQVAEAQATAQAIQTLHLGELDLAGLTPTRSPQSELGSSIPESNIANQADTFKIASPTIFDESRAGISDNSQSEIPSVINKPKRSVIVQEEPEHSTYNISTISPADPSLSVTDMIPLINMELKRLGWSREQGRDCIIELYNKRSSSLLSDEELLGLLRYLQAQTAAAE